MQSTLLSLLTHPAATHSVLLGLPPQDREDLMCCMYRLVPHPRIETISWKPRAFVYHNLLTMAEVDHLVKIGSQRVRQCPHWLVCHVW